MSPKNLTEGPVGRHLVRLTLPMIGGLFATMAFNATDTYFVAQLGTAELAAMSFTFPVVMVLTSLGIGLGAGTSSVLARAAGRAERSRIVRLCTDGLILASLLSALLALVGLFTIDPLFTLLGAGSETLPLIREYMVIWYYTLPFLIAMMVGGASLRAFGDTLTQGLVMIGAAVANVILDPLLIFGLAGLPRLELRGAAIATLVARIAALAVVVAVLHLRDRMLTLRYPALAVVVRSWRQILHVGLPAAGTNMIVPAATGVITALLATFGPEAVAAFGAASRVESVALILFYAQSATIGPFVGQNWGAGRGDRIRRALKLSFLFCMGFGALLAILLALLRTPTAELFSDNPDVVSLAATYLLLVPLSYGTYGVVMVANATFNALAAPLRAVVVSIVRMLLLYLPLAWLGSRLFGVPGIFTGAATANLLAGLLAWVMIRFTCRPRPTPEPVGGTSAAARSGDPVASKGTV